MILKSMIICAAALFGILLTKLCMLKMKTETIIIFTVLISREKNPHKLIDIPNTTAMTGSNVYFCANGIIGADRNPHPQIVEVKHGYQNIGITAKDIKNGEFTIKNKFLFTNLSDFNCKWVIKAEGKEVLNGTIGKIDCAPLEEKEIKIDYEFIKTF